MSVSKSLKNHVLAGIAFAGLAGVTAQAQTTAPAADLQGNYVFSEEGVTAAGARVTALSNLTFGDGGVVSGVVAAQTGNDIVSYGVQGNYQSNSDSSGTLTLNGTWSDSDGNDRTFSENLILISNPNGDISAIRTDAGYFTVAQIARAGQAGLKGDYLFTSSAPGRQYTRVVKLSFDGVGSVTGFEIVNSLGVTQRLSLQGSYVSQADGFVNLTLNVQTQDDNGELQNTVETYSYLAGASGARMIRSGSVETGIFTLIK
jgi:hypothetical protein